MKMNPSFFIGLLLMAACQTPSLPPISNEIVLIFHQPKVQGEQESETKAFPLDKCSLEYMDDEKIIRTFVPDSNLVYDTVAIFTKKDQLEFVHTYRKRDRLIYLFHRGDSVLFTYKAGKPYATILNRDEADSLINHDLYWRASLDSIEYPAHKRFVILEWFKSPKESRSTKKFKEQMAEIEDAIYLAAQRELNAEITFLEGLKTRERITDSLFQYRKSNALFQFKKKELEIKREFFSRFQTDEQLQPSDIVIYEEVDGAQIPIFDNILSEENANLISNHTYRDLLKIYHAFYGRKVKRIEERIDYNGKPGALMNNPDFLERYDSIEQSPFFAKDIKKLLLQWELENIILYKPMRDKEAYLNRFESTFADSSVMDFLHEKYAIGLIDTSNKEPDLELTSLDGTTLLYHDLLQKHKEKVIYVDFWSTSCRPCIGEMPSSETLKQDFEDKDVVFLQISLDADIDHWKNGCEKYNLNEGSYLMKNKYTSSEYERLGVKWIPHYMIYSRKGELVEYHAPRPSEGRTKELLNKYLGS